MKRPAAGHTGREQTGLSTTASTNSEAKRVKLQNGGNAKPAGILKKAAAKNRSAAINEETVSAPTKTARIAPQTHLNKGKARAVENHDGEEVSSSATPVLNGSALAKHTVRQEQIGTTSKRSLPTAFEIVAGSYERLLYGLHCTVSGTGKDTEIHAEPIFQFPAHLSALKTLHASPNGRWLVTGAADEVIKLWDLRKRKEIGGLLAHEGGSHTQASQAPADSYPMHVGDITSLVFPSEKYLLSSSADGTLALFRTRDWSLLRKFKGHMVSAFVCARHVCLD